jgi:hypothetical protein
MVGRWWYDANKAAQLEQAKRTDTSLLESDDGSDRPGFVWALVALIGIGLIGWIVFRRAVRSKGVRA